MSELKIQHLITLTELLSKGARHNYVGITTSTLGKKIGKSQQAASKHLLELEEGGFIHRIMSGRKVSVKLTQKGHDQISDMYNLLKNSLESIPSAIVLDGTLVAGMGEGKYYMSLKGYTKQFKEKIGYIPFPGTLNVKLNKKEQVESLHQLNNIEAAKVEGFSDGKRTYGWVKCFACKINGKVDAQLILLERTHHDLSTIELISKFEIRKKLGLKNGSAMSIKIQI
ncbi:MAG: CTP-dependent riboflavin kinase [Nitrosopumilaceae archaeon]|nr:CTP-dependent riboflavin kinase [Nitrososphaeria archaeon]NDB51655.1 CTP-dependent riboflavin kinase [Nitrosopumilaceae archaeon]NDB88699.1 CTP-dependent riboflavin kinase [Nitrososphaerota archaeon]NDF35037.1 CTP-dependent riboflavin kinase [Nitrosopumilaceae archaeon]NDF47813.1 CTP-dependent riboflavin kinase [Nitrosopumilaceae archaeon]